MSSPKNCHLHQLLSFLFAAHRRLSLLSIWLVAIITINTTKSMLVMNITYVLALSIHIFEGGGRHNEFFFLQRGDLLEWGRNVEGD